MLKWIGFLLLLGASVAIFIFAPLGLVGHFISQFTPAGLEWVGTAFSIGLSLSVVSNSFLARWKSMRLALVALIVLAVAESLMSGATLYGKALADGKLDLFIALGIVAIIVMQEVVLISGGLGMSMVLDKIGAEQQSREQRAQRRTEKLSRQQGKVDDKVAPVSQPETTVAAKPRPLARLARLNAIRHANASRNGDGPLTPAEIVATYHVSLRQAQRDVAAVAERSEEEEVAR